MIPQLPPLLQTLAPFADALLRIAVGLALIPHGLRNTFGLFPNTGAQALNLTVLAKHLDDSGYRPGKFWARAISITNIERWRIGKYFWNRLGLEYTLMWTIAVFWVFIHGGGLYSLDHVIGWKF